MANRRTDNTMANRMTDNTMKDNIDWQNTAQKTNDQKDEPLKKSGVNSCAPKSVNSSCYISGTHPVNVKRHEHEMSKFKCLLIKTYRHTL
jgi:hypothetical protein